MPAVDRTVPRPTARRVNVGAPARCGRPSPAATPRAAGRAGPRCRSRRGWRRPTPSTTCAATDRAKSPSSTATVIPGPAPLALAQAEQQQREEEVELLLDRQRPEVQERADLDLRGREVVVALGQELPVRDVQQRPLGVAHQRARPDRRQQHDRDGAGGQHHQDARPAAAGGPAGRRSARGPAARCPPAPDRMFETRKPESTKNRSTPMKPPPTDASPLWKSTTR